MTAPLSGDQVSETTLLRLKDALALAFPCGGMTVSGLKRERARGRLQCEMIAGKRWTTLRDITQMRILCREQQKEPVSVSISGSAGDARPDARIARRI
jgi:hypothetical protein